MKKKQVKVTLVRSLIGRQKTHIASAKGLGLRKINSSAVIDDTKENRGMINQISYLLRTEEA